MLLESHHIATDVISSFVFFQSASLLRYAICPVRLELDHSGACVGWSTVDAFSKQHVYQQESSSQSLASAVKAFAFGVTIIARRAEQPAGITDLQFSSHPSLLA